MSLPHGEIDAEPTGLSSSNDPSFPKVGLSNAEFKTLSSSKPAIPMAGENGMELDFCGGSRGFRDKIYQRISMIDIKAHRARAAGSIKASSKKTSGHHKLPLKMESLANIKVHNGRIIVFIGKQELHAARDFL